jgi:hypothetical protein
MTNLLNKDFFNTNEFILTPNVVFRGRGEVSAVPLKDMVIIFILVLEHINIELLIQLGLYKEIPIKILVKSNDNPKTFSKVRIPVCSHTRFDAKI